MFATAGCEYYICKQDNDRALQYINLIDIKKIKGGDLSFLDGGVSVVSYFTAQMELSMAMVCKKTGDDEGAARLMADAHRLAEESGKALNRQNLESYYREFPESF